MNAAGFCLVWVRYILINNCCTTLKMRGRICMVNVVLWNAEAMIPRNILSLFRTFAPSQLKNVLPYLFSSHWRCGDWLSRLFLSKRFPSRLGHGLYAVFINRQSLKSLSRNRSTSGWVSQSVLGWQRQGRAGCWLVPHPGGSVPGSVLHNTLHSLDTQGIS